MASMIHAIGYLFVLILALAAFLLVLLLCGILIAIDRIISAIRKLKKQRTVRT